MNSNVEVIGDMEPETALVFSAKAEGGYQPYVWEYAIYKGDNSILYSKWFNIRLS